MDLSTIKNHLRITFNFDDDDLLSTYLEWAEEEVKNTVSTNPYRHDEFFVNNPTYERAVTFLVTHFYENRKPIIDKPQYNLIYGANSAIFKLKTAYQEKYNEL